MTCFRKRAWENWAWSPLRACLLHWPRCTVVCPPQLLCGQLGIPHVLLKTNRRLPRKCPGPFQNSFGPKTKPTKKKGFPLGFPCKNTPPKLEPSCLFGLKIPPSAQGLKSAALLVDGHRSKTGVSHGYPFRWTNRVGQQGNGVAFRVVSTWLSGLG